MPTDRRTRQRTAAQLPFWPAPSPSTSPSPSTTRTSTPSPSRAEKKEAAESPAERAVRQRLQQRLSARVALKDKGGRGSFTVHYTSYDELDEIMRRIKA